MTLGWKTISWLSFIFIMGKIISMGTEAVWMSDTSLDVCESFTGYNVSELSGIGGFVTGGIGFLTDGFPQMLLWDYSFLGSEIEILNTFLIMIRIIAIVTISTGIVWAIIQGFMGLAQGVFGGLTRLFGL